MFVFSAFGDARIEFRFNKVLYFLILKLQLLSIIRHQVWNEHVVYFTPVF